MVSIRNIVSKIGQYSRNRSLIALTQDFYLQIAHEDIEFTAYGFFRYDLKLLVSVSGLMQEM